MIQQPEITANDDLVWLFQLTMSSSGLNRFRVYERANLEHYFEDACTSGRLQLVEWMVHNWKDDEKTKDVFTDFKGFCEACKQHLPVAKFLHQTFSLTPEQARFYDDQAFRNACQAGNVEALMFLHDQFGIGNRNDFHMLENAPIRDICYAGNIEVLKYAIERKLIDPEDLLEFGAECVYQACGNGGVHILRYMHQLLGFEVRMLRDLLEDNEYVHPICGAIENGQLDTLQYMCEIVGVTMDDIRGSAEKDNQDPDERDIERNITAACEDGHLNVIKYLNDKFTLQVKDIRQGFKSACGMGQLEMVRYLHKSVLQNSSKSKHRKRPSSKHRMLIVKGMIQAASHGSLSVVKYLCEETGLSVPDIRLLGSDDQDVVWYSACCNDKVEVARYIERQTQLDTNDKSLKKTKEDAFIGACRLGHVSTLRYLAERMVPDYKDHRRTIHKGLILATALDGNDNQLQVVQFLHVHYKLTAKALRARHHQPLVNAVEHDQLETVKYFYEAFQLTAHDIRHDDNRLLHLACLRGHTDIVRYFFEKVGLTLKDAQCAHFHVFSNALATVCGSNDPEDQNVLIIVKYLCEQVGMTKEDVYQDIPERADTSAIFFARSKHHQQVCDYFLQRYQKPAVC